MASGSQAELGMRVFHTNKGLDWAKAGEGMDLDVVPSPTPTPQLNVTLFDPENRFILRETHPTHGRGLCWRDGIKLVNP